MTEPHKLTDLVPVEVLTEVNTAIAVLEIQGPAITEALRQLDRATTMAWKAMHMLGVTDGEWELVKREIGIERGWEAAYQLVSTLNLPGVQPSADVTADGPYALLSWERCHGRERPGSLPRPRAFACLEPGDPSL
jgi:hypothetical protein